MPRASLGKSRPGVHGTEAVMRLFSWAGITALATAAGGGFLAGDAVHRHDPVTIQVCDAAGELSEAPPVRPVLTPPQPLEEIDPACPPTLGTGFALQSPEPPLADEPATGVVRPVNYEPPGWRDGSGLFAPMPYLTDDPAPGLLPPVGDVPELAPDSVSGPDSPLFQAVRRFMDNAARLPERPADITDKV